jgi:hypothetical protein
MRQNCSIQHVSQAPPRRTKCPTESHARRRPKREAEGREPAAFGHGDRGAAVPKLSAAVSPPGPQRIIVQMLSACGIQTDGSQHYVYTACIPSSGEKSIHGPSSTLVLNLVQYSCRSKFRSRSTVVYAHGCVDRFS